MPRSLKQKAAIQQQKVVGNVTKSMTPALSERYTQLMALYADNVEQTINFKYQLGSIFNDVSADPKTYGANASQLLMSALGINSKRDIDRVMLFAKTYTEADVERFNHWHEKFKNAKTRITWSHWDKLLVNYITEEERESWMDQICINGWSCAELFRQMKLKYSRPDGHGSKVKQPTSKEGILQKMNQPLSALKSFYGSVWENKQNPAGEQLSHNLSDVTEDTLTELTLLKSNIEDALDYLTSMLSQIESLKLEDLWLNAIKSQVAESPESADDSDDDASSLVDSIID